MHTARVLPSSPAEEPSWGQKTSRPAQAALLTSVNSSCQHQHNEVPGYTLPVCAG